MSETYTIFGDALYLLEANHIAGQTFSPFESHIVQYIDLNLKSSFYTAPPKVQIYLTNHLNEPTGDPLVNITIHPPSPLIPSISRVRVKIPNPFLLSKGTEYALLCLYELPIIGTRASWEYDATDATYPRGHRIHSENGGATWTHELGSDHIFCEFGDPPLPKPEPEPPVEHFAIPTIQYLHNPEGITITIATSVPCHLTCYYTDSKPLKHHTSRVIRGLSVPWGTYFCFVGWKAVEQTEPGDTLYHTFEFAEWPICSTILKAWDLEHGALPPYWEPWGTTLTENNPWVQAWPENPITYSLANGILTLENPIGDKSGIRCTIPWQTPIPLILNNAPLCFAAKSIEAKITNPSDFTAIHVALNFELEAVWIEFIANRGSAWGDFPKPPFILENIYFMDYGLDPTPIDLLDIFKQVRQSQGLSDDPTGWEADVIYDLLEHATDPTEMNHKVDFINLFHPTKQKIVSYGNERYFTFRGEVDSIKSPSVGPIFKHCHPGVDPFCNLSFEDYPITPGVPPCWIPQSYKTGTATYERDTVNVQHGLNSCKVTSEGMGFIARLAQYRWTVPYLNKTVKFTFNWFGSGRGHVGIGSKARYFNLGPGWHTWSATITFGAWPYLLYMRMGTGGAGSSYTQLSWDNITIEIL